MEPRPNVFHIPQATVEAATLCMVRLAELMLPGEPTLSQLIKVQENGHDKLPIDDYGDCKDVFELVTGMRTLPQDKTQRLYILALRETRLSGRMRQLCLVPTQSMTADPLTKSMVLEPMNLLLSCGIIRFRNEPGHPVLILTRSIRMVNDLDEEHLLRSGAEVIKEVEEKKATSNQATSNQNILFSAGCAAAVALPKAVPRALVFGACSVGAMAMTEEHAAMASADAADGGSFSPMWWLIVSTIGITIMVQTMIQWCFHKGQHVVVDNPFASASSALCCGPGR